MPADLANHAPATSEGYVRVQVDYGPSKSPRYISRYEKSFDCDGSSGALRVVEGRADNVQATADQSALDSLNAVRRYVYGTDATNVNKGAKTGQTLVVGKN